MPRSHRLVRLVRIPSRALTLGFGWLVCSSGAGRSEVVPAGRVEGHRGGADAAPRRPDGRPGENCCRTPIRFAVCSFDSVLRALRFEELRHARGMDLFVWSRFRMEIGGRGGVRVIVVSHGLHVLTGDH